MKSYTSLVSSDRFSNSIRNLDSLKQNSLPGYVSMETRKQGYGDSVGRETDSIPRCMNSNQDHLGTVRRSIDSKWSHIARTPGNNDSNKIGLAQANIDKQDCEDTDLGEITSFNTNNDNDDSQVESLLENSNNWMKNHQKGWLHGFVKPYTVLKYDLVSSQSTKSRLSKDYDQDILFPNIILEEISPKNLVPSIARKDRRESKDKICTDIPEVLRKAQPPGILSAFYTIPRTYINNAYSTYSGETFDLPKLCFQNSFECDGNNYTFGGLFVSETSDLTYLGIPKETPMEKISVHFPCKLPPFLCEKLLANPLVCQNERFFKSNPVRNTLSILDSVCRDDLPYHLNSLESCQIANKHIFFFGGFTIKTIAVDYMSQIDRWIIHKKLELNNDGYILDTITFKFSKVKLTLKTLDIEFGRLGSGITSTSLLTPETLDLPDRLPSPQIFTECDTRSAAQLSTENKHFIPNSQDLSTVLDISNTSSEISDRKDTNVWNPSNVNVHPTVYANLKHNKSHKRNRLSDMESVSVTKSNELSFVKSNEPNNETSLPRLFTNFKSGTGGSFSGSTNSSSHNSTTSSATPQSAVSRMSSVLSKSSRLFHRSKSSNVNQTSPANPLRNTYSKHLEKHRSNPSTGKPVSPRAISPSPANRLGAKASTENSSVNFDEASKPSTEYSKVSTPTTTQPIKQCNMSLPNSSLSTFESKCHNNIDKCDMIDESFVLHQKRLFVEEVMKSGVDSTTIFVFGGFTAEYDEEEFLTFKATNALLKIEIPSKRKGKTVIFDSEAMVKEIKPGKDDVWPSPRGYFAKSVIKYNNGHGENCDIDVYQTLKNYDEFKNNNQTNEMFTNSSINVGSEVSTEKDSLSIGEQVLQVDRSSSSQSLLNVPISNSPGNFSLNGKAFFIQGGIDENYKSFTEFYLYLFDTGKWQLMNTYAYDYFNVDKQPFEDEDTSKLTKESEIDDPSLVDAELRACHHTALYHENGDYDYLIFLGGFRNDFLRHYDKEKYQSNAFDISRLSKIPFATNNTNISRIPVLNLRTQTWKFVRYFFDIDDVVTEKYAKRVERNDYWINANLEILGSSITMVGKKIVFYHGLSTPVTEKFDDYSKMKQEVPTNLILLGGVVQITCPGL